MLEAFISKRFSSLSEYVIQQTNLILEDYAARGYDLTLRQLYYQFVSRGWMENKQTEYKRLGAIMNDARLAGRVDWSYMVDRTRKLEIENHWENPREIIESCAKQYHEDMWANQNYYVEVWVEKDALVGVLERACVPLDVPYFSCRGYPSVSEVKVAADRISSKQGKDVVIIHLGDHDPSGIDMTRDIERRLELLSCGGIMHVKRIALNLDQIRKYDPPPNPAKVTDSRYAEYTLKYGESSWELDALDPDVLVELIATAVGGYIDQDQWEEDKAQITTRRAQLALVSKHWDEVTKFVEAKK